MTVRRSRIMSAYFAAMLLLFSNGIFAAETSPPVSISPFASFMQMLLALGIVLAAIAGMAWLLRRLSPGQLAITGDMRVVAAVAVGPKERVVLVDIGDTRLVLGVAPGQVNRLMEMPRPDFDETPQPNTPPFVIKLKELLASRGKSS
jgi:flagellar protein FliO/FliZ